MSDPRQRRGLLATADNPRRSRDLLVQHAIDVAGQPVALRYVPDLLLLDVEACAPYFEALQELHAAELAVTMFEDLASELVPRWMALRAGGDAAAVLLHEQRATWSNPALLALLKPW